MSLGVGTGRLGVIGAPRYELNIRVNGRLARYALDQRAYDAKQQSLWPKTDDLDMDARRWEIVYRMKNGAFDFAGDGDENNFAIVATSLNDLPVDPAFSNDPHMARQFIMDSIEPLGIWHDDVAKGETADGLFNSNAAIFVTGLVTFPAYRKLTTGKYLRCVPHYPLDQGEDRNFLPNNMPRTKCVLRLEEIDMSGMSFAHTLQMNMKHFIMNKDAYRAAYDKISKIEASKRLANLATLRNFIMYNAIIVAAFAGKSADEAKQRSYTVVFEDLLKRSELCSGREPSPPAVEFLNKMQRHAALDSPAQYKTDLAVGWEDDTKKNVFLSAMGYPIEGAYDPDINGRLGLLMEMQLNMHKQFYAAMGAFMHSERPFAKCVRGVDEHGVAEIVLTP